MHFSVGEKKVACLRFPGFAVKISHLAAGFLDQEYTLFRYREHQWQPRLTSRLEWREFQRQKGGKDMRQRANERARELLANPYPQILDEKLAKELERLARAQQKRHMRRELKNG